MPNFGTLQVTVLHPLQFSQCKSVLHSDLSGSFELGKMDSNSAFA